MRRHALILACILTPTLFGEARAQDCTTRPATGAVAGTLTAPQPPCPARGRERPTDRKQGRKDEPGVIRNGNTTIYFGGSVQTDTTIRGR